MIRIRNKQKEKEYNRKQYLKNRESILEKAKERHYKNRDLCVERMREYHENNPKLFREYHWKKIGIEITYEQYQEMLEKQDHRCYLCKRHESELKKALGVDHDHETGRVRALLCKSCNLAIGFLGDNPNLLEKAARYLRDFNG